MIAPRVSRLESARTGGIAKRLSSCVWCALGWDERRYGKTTTLPQRYCSAAPMRCEAVMRGRK